MGSQALEQLVGVHIRHKGIVLLVASLEPVHRLFRVTEANASYGDRHGDGVTPIGLFQQLLLESLGRIDVSAIPWE